MHHVVLPRTITAIVLVANAAITYVPSAHEYVVRFNGCDFAIGVDMSRRRTDMLLLRAAGAAKERLYFGVTSHYHIACPVERVDTIVLTGPRPLHPITQHDALERLGTKRVLPSSQMSYTMHDCNRDVNVTSCSIGAYGAMLMQNMFPDVPLYLCGFSFHKESAPTRWHEFDKERVFFSTFQHIC